MFQGPAFLDYWQPRIKQIREAHGLVADATAVDDENRKKENLDRLDQMLMNHLTLDMELLRLTASLVGGICMDEKKSATIDADPDAREQQYVDRMISYMTTVIDDLKRYEARVNQQQ